MDPTAVVNLLPALLLHRRHASNPPSALREPSAEVFMRQGKLGVELFKGGAAGEVACS
eukprot:CAMPEP_0114120704 /NCGR_PEP_ID=MMETSP0043_2-20121206/6794_1 /TAXON_ID=464988 /ORGANISM="Hemiselmis andersenii, Strain CCMP644" /LENGTH=57 /DNA_ID=CAMNT_0001213351 /DNA_START=327 /DNA_END=496 /DNA_ORIENTATION=+